MAVVGRPVRKDCWHTVVVVEVVVGVVVRRIVAVAAVPVVVPAVVEKGTVETVVVGFVELGPLILGIWIHPAMLPLLGYGTLGFWPPRRV